MFSKKSMSELDRVSTDEHKVQKHFPVTILLDDVRSMNNVGSVFRTADAFNIESIGLCGFTPRPPHRDIQKTALGATESVHWNYFNTIREAVRHYQDKGYQIWAVEQTHLSTSLEKFKPDTSKPLVLIMGNEVDGVSNEALQYCDGVLEIPQWGSKHSLNISVATGVVLWQVIQPYR